MELPAYPLYASIKIVPLIYHTVHVRGIVDHVHFVEGVSNCTSLRKANTPYRTPLSFLPEMIIFWL